VNAFQDLVQHLLLALAAKAPYSSHETFKDYVSYCLSLLVFSRQPDEIKSSSNLGLGRYR
jgi:hypothetical protein